MGGTGLQCRSSAGNDAGVGFHFRMRVRICREPMPWNPYGNTLLYTLPHASFRVHERYMEKRLRAKGDFYGLILPAIIPTLLEISQQALLSSNEYARSLPRLRICHANRICTELNNEHLRRIDTDLRYTIQSLQYKLHLRS